LQRNPGNARLHLSLGALLEDRGDLVGACESYRLSLMLDPAQAGVASRVRESCP
jgi:Flp pilus assembly protein TadD